MKTMIVRGSKVRITNHESLNGKTAEVHDFVEKGKDLFIAVRIEGSDTDIYLSMDQIEV